LSSDKLVEVEQTNGRIDLPQKVLVGEIVVDKRMRQRRDPDDLVESMNEIGLLQPIGVRGDGRLLYGLHRTLAAQKLGWTYIDAYVHDVDDEEARLIEIDENLKRHGLTKWEESTHIEEREKILKAKRERAEKGDNQWSAQVEQTSTNQERADDIGMSNATYRRRKAIAENMSDGTKELLNQSTDEGQYALPNNQRELEKLARIRDKEVQEEVAHRVLNGEAKNIQDAIGQIAVEQERSGKSPEEIEKIQKRKDRDQAAKNWSKLLRDALGLAGSLKGYGVKNIAGRWPDKDVGYNARECRKLADAFDDFATEMEEMERKLEA
jgi:ParB family chromosome partitioning protein